MTRRFTGTRQHSLILGSIAASGLVLSGCGENVPQEQLFATVEECRTAGISEQICTAEYQEALSRQIRDAPRFNDQAACEAEYGVAKCLRAEDPDNGSSFFMPFMAGYVVSSALRNFTSFGSYSNFRRTNAYTPTPIYRNRAGDNVTTAGGSQRVARPYNVNTRTVSRQGFGGRSSGRGFGG